MSVKGVMSRTAVPRICSPAHRLPREEPGALAAQRMFREVIPLRSFAGSKYLGNTICMIGIS
jgi:hypothetical protein